jgi:hypothetical protein
VPVNWKALLGEGQEPWRIIAEKKIQKWIEGGGPDRLTNRGRPLDLRENPFVPSELRMAFDVLKNADAAPPWIEVGRELEAALANSHQALLRFHDLQRTDRLAIGQTSSLDRIEALRERMRKRADSFAAEHRERLRELNFTIDRFNAYCPVHALRRARVDVEAEVAAALAPPKRAA